MASRNSWSNQGAFRVSVWLGDANAVDIRQVAQTHNSSYYYIEARSQYFQSCKVHLRGASGLNAGPPLVEFSESNVASSTWVRSPLMTLPPAPPIRMTAVQRSRRASIRSIPPNCVGVSSEDVQAQLEYEVLKILAVPALVIDVDL
jgi:hypothetical protein